MCLCALELDRVLCVSASAPELDGVQHGSQPTRRRYWRRHAGRAAQPGEGAEEAARLPGSLLRGGGYHQPRLGDPCYLKSLIEDVVTVIQFLKYLLYLDWF